MHSSKSSPVPRPNTLRHAIQLSLMGFAALWLTLGPCLVAQAAPASAPRCSICKQRITGRYFRGNGRIVCSRCYKRYDKCDVCGVPARDLYPAGGHHVCATCYHKAPKCAACGGPIVGKYYKIPYQVGRFCQQCFEERPHCDFCGRPIVKDGKVLADGRRSCADCAADSVKTTDEALDVLASVARFMETHYGMVVRRPYDLVLVDKSVINHIAGRPEDAPMRELGLYSQGIIPGNTRPMLFMLTDLPRRAFLEVLAHEYAHMWMFENHPDVSDMDLIEGFAQWAAAKWLEARKEYSALARLEARTDPYYGVGYRRLRGLEIDQSESDVMRYVLQYGRKPEEAPQWPQKMFASKSETDARAAKVKPLSEILPENMRTGLWAFVNQAVPVVPEQIRLRRPAEVREAMRRARSKDAAPANAR